MTRAPAKQHPNPCQVADEGIDAIQARLERGGVDSATWFELRRQFSEQTGREVSAPADSNQPDGEVS